MGKGLGIEKEGKARDKGGWRWTSRIKQCTTVKGWNPPNSGLLQAFLLLSHLIGSQKVFLRIWDHQRERLTRASDDTTDKRWLVMRRWGVIALYMHSQSTPLTHSLHHKSRQSQINWKWTRLPLSWGYGFTSIAHTLIQPLIGCGGLPLLTSSSLRSSCHVSLNSVDGVGWVGLYLKFTSLGLKVKSKMLLESKDSILAPSVSRSGNCE